MNKIINLANHILTVSYDNALSQMKSVSNQETVVKIVDAQEEAFEIKAKAVENHQGEEGRVRQLRQRLRRDPSGILEADAGRDREALRFQELNLNTHKDNKNMTKNEIITFLAVFILAFAFFAVVGQDKVIVDERHDVFCVEDSWGYLLGCMDGKGNQVANKHANH